VSYVLEAGLVALALLLGMLLFLEIGRRAGVRRRSADPQGAAAGTGAVEGAVFGLLGLLIAFTFSGASTRFDVRRHLIVDETNAVGTAYLRIDMLPPAAQPGLRELFKRYLDSRLDTYRKLPDVAAVTASLATSARLQQEIWRAAVAGCQAAAAGPQCATLLMPALNAMFDITTTRTMASYTHPPSIIFVMLFGLALASALLAGFGMGAARERSWLHMIGFAAAVAAATYVILDLEFPRLGMLRVDTFDQALVDLRRGMDGPAD